MEYIYSLYDPQTSKLLYSGTPEQLVKAGLYKRKGAVSAAYRVQVEGARPKRYRIERERADAAESTAYCHKVKEKPKPQPKPAREDETPLQRDVHRMCLYNEAALKAGKKELQYGYWAAAGKPEAPVW
nr:MAG TPA_asm: hypothetical protein [Caudoviricetes sp.]